LIDFENPLIPFTHYQKILKLGPYRHMKVNFINAYSKQDFNSTDVFCLIEMNKGMTTVITDRFDPINII